MAFALLCWACSPVKVLQAEKDPSADLSKYTTFGFYDVSASGDTLSAVFNDRLQTLKDAIAAELVQRGYTQVGSGAALLVNIGIAVDEKVQTRMTDWLTDGAPRYIGQRNYSWKSQEVETGRYREGTVTVHLVDAAQRRMVWQGAIQGVVSGNAAEAEKNIRTGIRKLFQTFGKF